MNIATSLTLNANRHPDKMAITCEERVYSYKELNEEVNRFANGLLQLGFDKGDKVAIFMKNSDHFVIAFFAIIKAGLVAVPVNFRLTVQETSYIVEQSDTVAVICDKEFEQTVSEAGKGIANMKHVIVHSAAEHEGNLSWNQVKSQNAQEPKVLVLITDDAEILYTSGTTGLPKGALFDHQRLISVAISYTLCAGLSKDDRMLYLAPLFHSAQLNGILVTSILLGISSVIHRDFHPVRVLEDVERYKPTYFFGVPIMYNAILQVPTAGNYDLSSVKACMYGAAPMAPGLIEGAMKLFKTDQFYNFCGLTEAGPGGVYLTPEGHKNKLGAGGKAMFLFNVRVVNDNMEDVQPGEIGEFIMKGETIMKEYYRNPEATQKTFVDGWLLTGDLATIDTDGFITVVDRKKDMIISGGENIYSVEVEQVLNSYPAILEAATIGLPDEKWGEVVVAVIVPKEGATIDEEDLASYCRERIAGYKIPKKFLYKEALPRNTSGKILKYQLRESL